MTVTRILGGVSAAALAIGVGAVLFVRSGTADEVDLTSAELVPADSFFYAGLNTDLKSRQWVAAFAFARELGTDDPEGELQDAVEEDGAASWEEIVEFLGGDASLFIRGYDADGGMPLGGVIIKPRSGTRALRILTEQMERDEAFGDQRAQDVSEETRGGFRYFVYDNGESGDTAYFALMGEHLVITFDEDSLFAVHDVAIKRAPAIAELAEFRRLRDELSGNFLSFVYLDPMLALEAIDLDEVGVPDLLSLYGMEREALKPIAAVAGAKKDAIEWQYAIPYVPPSNEMLQTRTSRFVTRTPASAEVFVSLFGVAPKVAEGIAALPAVVPADLGVPAGLLDGTIAPWAEVIETMSGELAFAAWGIERLVTMAGPGYLLFSEVADEDAARSALENLEASLGLGRAVSEDVKGVTVRVVASGKVAWAVDDGFLVVGEADAVRTVFDPTEPPLGHLKPYLRTIEASPTGLGAFAWFDLPGLVAASGQDLPHELRFAKRYLQGLLINAVAADGLTRVSGVVVGASGK